MQQNKEEEKPNCARHKKEVAGISDMKALAEMIGDLHYKTLADLLLSLTFKLLNDYTNDDNAGRVKLANDLFEAAMHIEEASEKINDAWEISKPFMNIKTEIDGQ